MFGFPGVVSPIRGDADQQQAASSVPALPGNVRAIRTAQKSKP